MTFLSPNLIHQRHLSQFNLSTQALQLQSYLSTLLGDAPLGNPRNYGIPEMRKVLHYASTIFFFYPNLEFYTAMIRRRGALRGRQRLSSKGVGATAPAK